MIVLIFAMTAAWFTNVAKTSDLVFQTESWGFAEDKITVGESPAVIAPGTSGSVPLSIDNSDGTESVKIGITVNKSELDQELQKRLFFYADTQKNVTLSAEAEAETVSENQKEAFSETAQRTYLGSSAPDNYVYTILPGQKLVIDDLYANNTAVKWEWVYDMTGYYFRGTVDEGENKVTTEEYLRPVEYDSQLAVYDSQGQLQSVDLVPLQDFLKEFSEKDGYIGTISAQDSVTITDEQGNNSIYYPVEVDENGYGVWAYLCTLPEILEANQFDTKIAGEEPVNAAVKLTLTANNVPMEKAAVAAESLLREKLADPSVDIIELGSDITLDTPITFEEGTKVLDLQGYALHYDGAESEYEVIHVKNGASLTLMNGQIIGNTAAPESVSGAKTIAVKVTGASVVMSGMKVSGFDSALYTADMAEGELDSTVQIIGCEFQAAQTAVYLQGNGSVSEAMTKMFIQDSRIISERYLALSGQGKNQSGDERWGTELVMVNCDLQGYYGGIYHPQQRSTAVLNQCRVSGNTGIAVKGGTVSLYDCEVTGSGAVQADPAANAGGGFTDTGDGIYLEAGYDWSASVVLKGENIVKSEKAYGLELFGVEKKGPGKIMVYDGTYDGPAGSANWNGSGNFEIYGGTFPKDVNELITRFDQ